MESLRHNCLQAVELGKRARAAVRSLPVRPVCAWYDCWIGGYWDREKRRLYSAGVALTTGLMSVGAGLAARDAARDNGLYLRRAAKMTPVWLARGLTGPVALALMNGVVEAIDAQRRPNMSKLRFCAAIVDGIDFHLDGADFETIDEAEEWADANGKRFTGEGARWLSANRSRSDLVIKEGEIDEPEPGIL